MFVLFLRIVLPFGSRKFYTCLTNPYSIVLGFLSSKSSLGQDEHTQLISSVTVAAFLGTPMAQLTAQRCFSWKMQMSEEVRENLFPRNSVRILQICILGLF